MCDTCVVWSIFTDVSEEHDTPQSAASNSTRQQSFGPYVYKMVTKL
jgi:hypothetical protein